MRKCIFALKYSISKGYGNFSGKFFGDFPLIRLYTQYKQACLSVLCANVSREQYRRRRLQGFIQGIGYVSYLSFILIHESL